jgi:hypothetical protein
VAEERVLSPGSFIRNAAPSVLIAKFVALCGELGTNFAICKTLEES